MRRTFTVRCGSEVATAVDSLARRHDIPHEEVVKQLLEVGIEEVE